MELSKKITIVAIVAIAVIVGILMWLRMKKTVTELERIEGWNFPRNDLVDADGKYMVITETPEQCVERCQGIEGCKVAQWFAADKNCWSKAKATGAYKSETGVAIALPGYSFPLDEDEILESDYIRHLTGKEAVSGSMYDYGVSMNTVHTYLMPKEDSIQAMLCPGSQPETANSQSSQLFNVSVALY